MSTIYHAPRPSHPNRLYQLEFIEAVVGKNHVFHHPINPNSGQDPTAGNKARGGHELLAGQVPRARVLNN